MSEEHVHGFAGSDQSRGEPPRFRFDSGESEIKKLLERPKVGEGQSHERFSTVFEVIKGNRESLRELSKDGGLWLVSIYVDDLVLSADEPLEGRHLFFVVLDDGETLVAECSSNIVLGDRYQLSAEEELELAELGWRPPSDNLAPNWSVKVKTSEGLDALCELASITLTDVFKLSLQDRVVLGFQERKVV
jgi:hypothetical protein